MDNIASLTLLVFPLDGTAPARRVTLDQASVTVGREPDNTVALSDATVSRHHLTFTRRADGSWRMERIPTARALYYNGEPRDAALAQHGDQIVIGQTVIHIELPEPARQEQPAGMRTLLTSMPVARLRVECPGIQFETPLRQGTITIGRAAGNTLIVPSPVIGAQHAVLQRGAHGQYTIQAPTARNAFVFQGAPVRSHTFTAGDVMVVGEPAQGQYATLTYLEPEKAPQTAGRLDIGANAVVTIGRDPASALPLPSPVISWRHARLTRASDGRATLDDLGSRNGTYVNYQLLTRPRALNPGDRIHLGPYTFLFDGAALAPAAPPAAGLRIDAVGLTRAAGAGRVALLKDVSLTIRPGEFVTIVGGSGAGKTTLLNALAGIQPAQGGRVFFDGVDSSAHYDLFRGRIGYVPQRDIVHKELTVDQALYYVARLRLPADLQADEVAARIEQALEMVELTPRRSHPVGRLSGGEQKRVSLAVELLADPQILFLDEPNAALDPDLRGELQRTIRTLTARGQTVVMVTHFLEDIEACDRVAIMGRGGSLCYYGPPAQALSFFQVAHLKDIYAQTNTEEKAGAWVRRYATSGLYATDAGDRQAHLAYAPDGAQTPPQQAGGHSSWTPYTRRQSLPAAAQFWLLARRYARVLAHDPRRLAILLLQAPIIGLVLALVSQDHAFISASGPFEAQKVLFFLAIVAIWFGTSNAASEISKEVDIYQRERLAGLRIAPYLLSKVVVLAGLGMLQTLLLLLIVTLKTGLPPSDAGLFAAPSLELYIGMTLAGLAGLAMGLCVSALASNPDKATGAVPLVLLPQILLAGIIFPIAGNLQPVADVTISRWAVQALGTSADLNHLYYTQRHALVPSGAPVAASTPGYTASDYDSAPDANHYTLGVAPGVSWADALPTRRTHLVETWGAVIGLFVIFLGLGGVALKRKDPH